MVGLKPLDGQTSKYSSALFAVHVKQIWEGVCAHVCVCVYVHVSMSRSFKAYARVQKGSPFQDSTDENERRKVKNASWIDLPFPHAAPISVQAALAAVMPPAASTVLADGHPSSCRGFEGQWGEQIWLGQLQLLTAPLHAAGARSCLSTKADPPSAQGNFCKVQTCLCDMP